jgi:hypothetical protein
VEEKEKTWHKEMCIICHLGKMENITHTYMLRTFTFLKNYTGDCLLWMHPGRGPGVKRQRGTLFFIGYPYPYFFPVTCIA